MNTQKLSYGELKKIAYQQVADSLGKKVEDLVPWVDYDPISLDDGCYYESRGLSGVRWTGD